MTVLVLGATGLLGHAVFRRLRTSGASVLGTIRDGQAREFFRSADADRLLMVDDLTAAAELARLLDRAAPSTVINCLAPPKEPREPMQLFVLHSALPQRLAHLCRLRQCRLISFSSDGVFSGSRGHYGEDDLPDADDSYGLAKLLGEVRDPHTLTLRTSIIGHELRSKAGLLEWFLAQEGEARGYSRAIFSGFPNVVLAEILLQTILPRPTLSGIYHVASHPISKFSLLQLIAARYQKNIRIIPDPSIAIDRSLNGERFACATGYVTPGWPDLVDAMFRQRPERGDRHV